MSGQSIGPGDVRLDIKHRQRLAAYIQLMQDSGGNDGGAAG
jgi:hypothetical protein